MIKTYNNIEGLNERLKIIRFYIFEMLSKNLKDYLIKFFKGFCNKLINYPRFYVNFLLFSKYQLEFTPKDSVGIQLRLKKSQIIEKLICCCCITSCGRSGTNLVTEILSGNSYFTPTIRIQDRSFFKRKIKYSKGYLTKCEIIHYELNDFKETMNINQNLKIIWTIRDPRDMILSKIRRGQSIENGGEKKGIAFDATPDGSVQNIVLAYNYYRYIKKKFGKRILLVKMEDIILNIEKESKRICNFLNISYNENMLNFMIRMRNVHKRQRYTTLDKGQLELWKKWETIYDGFFTKNQFNIEELFNRVKPIVKYFKYN